MQRVRLGKFVTKNIEERQTYTDIDDDGDIEVRIRTYNQRERSEVSKQQQVCQYARSEQSGATGLRVRNSHTMHPEQERNLVTWMNMFHV